MNLNDSEFYHFGILPQVSIHSPIYDQYSDMYIPRETCDCGCKEWKEEGCTMILGHYQDGTRVYKDVHRCKNCKEVRMADHIGIKDQEGK
jgi:hypothetical protein